MGQKNGKKRGPKSAKKVPKPGRGGKKCPAPNRLRPPRPSGLHGFHYPLLFDPQKPVQKLLFDPQKPVQKWGTKKSGGSPPLPFLKIYSIYLVGGEILASDEIYKNITGGAEKGTPGRKT